MYVIFQIIAKLYNLTFTTFENIVYKKFHTNNELEKNGYIILKNQLNNLIDYSNSDILTVNKYFKKIIFTDSQIRDLLVKLFVKEKLFQKITNLTGFNYSIDFLTAYETLYIPDEDKSKGWYANHIHNDKPFTKNTLKLIIPLEKIENENGPMEIINKNESNNFDLNENRQNLLKFIGLPSDIFIFKPNLCLHRAGVPSENKNRKQIMLQLNPSKNWVFNKSIHKLQKIREPKFPNLSYLLDQKEKLL